jgi:transcriptional regulator with XRE-family HTH domain
MSPRRLKTVLKALREQREWSMAELAKKADVTDAYIAQLETGKRKNPSLEVLRRIAKALGVPVGELLE